MNEKTSDPCYVICPYCGEGHGDCWEWVTDNVREEQCQNPECGKTFACYAEYDVTYCAEPVEDDDKPGISAASQETSADHPPTDPDPAAR